MRFMLALIPEWGNVAGFGPVDAKAVPGCAECGVPVVKGVERVVAVGLVEGVDRFRGGGRGVVLEGLAEKKVGRVHWYGS
ncbi:MAG: hypothetical protein HKP54_11105 [Boseongicola sp.]|nr:hypothetical protein [Boseongicola sp.]